MMPPSDSSSAQSRQSGDTKAPLTVATEAEAQLDRRVGLIPSRSAILLVGFALALLALAVFGWLAGNLYTEEATILDDSLGSDLHGLSSPALDTAMWFTSLVGSLAVIGPIFVTVAGWLLWRRRWREALFLAVALLGGGALNQMMKVFFHRPRPVLPWAEVIPEYSFPSGHSMNSFVFYAALALITWVVLGRRKGIAAFCAA
ncbi:MAG: phosphatase PAP2 family protein, partial [Chloroflexota bacterium]|nr:phosphatase PAP2 family protein [Chloroflexota bacterium]